MPINQINFARWYKGNVVGFWGIIFRICNYPYEGFFYFPQLPQF
jgi:hypothetical protein